LFLVLLTLLFSLSGAVLGEYSDFGQSSSAAKTATQPSRIYSARKMIRRADEPGPFHNFPESFNQQIFVQGSRTVTPNFWKTAKPGLGVSFP
jgi:hypothetical protein